LTVVFLFILFDFLLFSGCVACFLSVFVAESALAFTSIALGVLGGFSFRAKKDTWWFFLDHLCFFSLGFVP
jgi:hypothetical protein